MFSAMLDMLREKTTFLICRAQIQTNDVEDLPMPESPARNIQAIHETPESLVGGNNGGREEEKQLPFQYSKDRFDPQIPKPGEKFPAMIPVPAAAEKIQTLSWTNLIKAPVQGAFYSRKKGRPYLRLTFCAIHL